MVRWLSFGEISEELGISLQSLYFCNRRGTGPKAYRFGKHYRVLEKDLWDWQRNQLINQFSDCKEVHTKE